MRRITPDIIRKLNRNEVLVFESSLRGEHRCGNAKLAFEVFGAKKGVGIGMQGSTYAIPAQGLSLSQIKTHIITFIQFAANAPDKHFLVTNVGCELAGYKPEDIAPLFETCGNCNNISLPIAYWKIIDKIGRKRKYRDSAQEIEQPVYVIQEYEGIKTSYYPHFAINVQIQGGMLIVSSGISNRHISLCTIIKEQSIELEKDYLDGNVSYIKRLPNLKSSRYILDLYFQKDKKGLYYRQLSVPLDVKGCVTQFSSPIFYDHNSSFFAKLPVDDIFFKSKLKLTAVVPGALVEFRNLATKITKYDSSEYNKLLSVHDWIAKNIYYDYDSLYDGSYKKTPLEKTAIIALRSKKCVCQGYTDLSVALLRSIGIPAMGVFCWAFGEGDDNPSNTSESNHIFTAAYCDQRWILCDITWDSRNRYEKESFDEDKKLSHTYFDSTVKFLSYTHKFIGFQ